MRELASGVIDESFGGWHGQELEQAVAWIIFFVGVSDGRNLWHAAASGQSFIGRHE